MPRIAAILELEEQLERKPRQLSGGQRQRVAMGRAMIREPQAFLMDEPLSNLDAKLRTQMRAEIGLLHKEIGVTTIYVTHDQVEAMTLGERVAVMRMGELQQVAAPQELYTRPANLFVAGFIGSPAMNFFEGSLESRDRTALGRVRRRAAASGGRRGTRPCKGTRVIYGPARDRRRPPGASRGRVARAGRPDDRRLQGQVRLRELLGSEVVVHFEVDAAPVVRTEMREIAEDIDASALTDLDRLRAARRTRSSGGSRSVRGSGGDRGPTSPSRRRRCGSSTPRRGSESESIPLLDSDPSKRNDRPERSYSVPNERW